MKVAKWGNSLAVRLPVAVVEELGLKEGDDVDFRRATERTLEIVRDTRREEALARLRSIRRMLPADYRFDREDANAR